MVSSKTIISHLTIVTWVYNFAFTKAHKEDDDILRQKQTLYTRSNGLIKIFHGYSDKAIIEPSRSFGGSF